MNETLLHPLTKHFDRILFLILGETIPDLLMKQLCQNYERKRELYDNMAQNLNVNLRKVKADKPLPLNVCFINTSTEGTMVESQVSLLYGHFLSRSYTKVSFMGSSEKSKLFTIW